MAEDNGNLRLSRIEAALEKLGERADQLLTSAYLHENRLIHAEAAIEELIENAKHNEQEHARSLQHQHRLDERVDKLVTAIGERIQRIPPAPR
jgi:hypothetical protein